LLKILSFDLDGTLFPNSIDDRLWFELIPEELANARNISIEKAKEYATREYDIIGPNDPRWYIPEYWIDRFGLDIDINYLLDRMEYSNYIYDDVIYLKELSNRFDIIIASNNARSMLNKKVRAINRLGIKIKASFSVVSDLNLTGKNTKFYKYICNSLGIKADEVMHIGDNIIYDLLHARASGLLSILIDRDNLMQHVDVIHSLYELKEVTQLL
jgi:putative hydrolase of the HAD superfamily